MFDNIFHLYYIFVILFYLIQIYYQKIELPDFHNLSNVVGSEEENNWTTSSHYMVLLDINKDGFVYVSNPNGLDGEEKSSRLV